MRGPGLILESILLSMIKIEVYFPIAEIFIFLRFVQM